MCLVALAGCGGARRTTAASATVNEGRAAPAVLPRTPSRADIVEAMTALSDDVGACGRGERLQRRVSFQFDSSGTLRTASVDPDDVWGSDAPGPGCTLLGGSYECRRARAPTPEIDACVERAVRGARVPPFSSPTFTVNFPFRLGGG